MGQFLTPLPVARLMASMVTPQQGTVNVLDAGAGVGSLAAALVAEACQWRVLPGRLSIVAYEVATPFMAYLEETLDACGSLCRHQGVEFVADVRQQDFVSAAVGVLGNHRLFERTEAARVDVAILNPPYRKIRTDSRERRLLTQIGMETSNLYPAFLWLAMRLLESEGQLIAITPRSFCNGPYFRPFRRELVHSMNFRRIHIFDSRRHTFAEDKVLQENIIFHAIKTSDRTPVQITGNEGPQDPDVTVREISRERLVQSRDPNSFIHIVPDELGEIIDQKMRGLAASLADLGLNVSTGRVVDFRAKHLLRIEPGDDTAPLIYPGHIVEGFVSWPSSSITKPNAIALKPDADDLLVPTDFYVLVKRFSAKEERRRVVAAVYDPTRVIGDRVGFENHLNYYHHNGHGLPATLAKGLTVFLNSTLVDSYFRQFSGHTQVNANDLRSLRYPSLESLLAMGTKAGEHIADQDTVDNVVSEALGMAKRASIDAVRAKKKLSGALTILRALDVPREQQNERSGLVLLALLGMTPRASWRRAADPLLGVTEIMERIRDQFGKTYAPNTRETVRRFTIHQFVQMGLVLANPDERERPINSPNNRYQVEPTTLKLLRSFEGPEWDVNLAAYRVTAAALTSLHQRERRMAVVPVKLPDGRRLKLTAGGQNLLVKDIVEKFCPRFTPGGTVIYVGDAGEKYLYFDSRYLERLGVRIDEHGKMPDVIVHHTTNDWLVLVEAVTTHGPVNIKRHNELKRLFDRSKAGLVFVTAFLTRKAMLKYLDEIAWETEVWVAEAPSHLIHFNGERFLGPYRRNRRR
ncbi:MAG: Eco57I restriction-modification methylase domain-containing protein [Deltaproteobacteria bacterium]|nr:Eco57I restriction-modification methylase domain-containing protein [Deltaproteobacteria bacterium]